MVGSLDQRRRGDGAGVDHRIERSVAPFVEHNRVKRFAAGLDANFFQNLFRAVIFQSEGVNKGLGDRLDGK